VGPQAGQIDESVFKESAIPLKGSILIYTHDVPDIQCIFGKLFEQVYHPLYKLLYQLVLHFHGIRAIFKIIVDLEEIRFGVILDDVPISSSFMNITHTNFIDRIIVQNVSYVIESLNLFLQNGKHWISHIWKGFAI